MRNQICQLKCVLCLTARKRNNIDWGAQSFACQCASLAQDCSFLIAAWTTNVYAVELGGIHFVQSGDALYAGLAKACWF